MVKTKEFTKSPKKNAYSEKKRGLRNQPEGAKIFKWTRKEFSWKRHGQWQEEQQVGTIEGTVLSLHLADISQADKATELRYNFFFLNNWDTWAHLNAEVTWPEKREREKEIIEH